MSAFATIEAAHKALGELDLAGLPQPTAIAIGRDYDDYTRWTAAVHVSESIFDEWFLSIGAEGFKVRHRGADNKYIEMVAIARNGVEVFCLVRKDSLEPEVSA